MKVILKDRMVILIPETPTERGDVSLWKELHVGHVLAVAGDPGEGLALGDLGLRDDACREPINIASNAPHPAAKLVSNFGDAPFVLDGQDYASVESFWQSLKFEKNSDRRRIAALPGAHARNEGEDRGYGATVRYGETDIPVGTYEHWQLMRLACEAKFDQHFEAREALLSTGDRPLTHVVRRDSRTIPGVLMAEIWMRIRKKLREGE